MISNIIKILKQDILHCIVQKNQKLRNNFAYTKLFTEILLPKLSVMAL